MVILQRESTVILTHSVLGIVVPVLGHMHGQSLYDQTITSTSNFIILLLYHAVMCSYLYENSM